MKPALTSLFCWLMTSLSLHAQATGKLGPTGNFMLVEERVKTVSAIEYRSTVVVMAHTDTLPTVPVRPMQRPALRVIPAKPDWPNPEPIIDEESGPHFILMGFPQPGGKVTLGRPWPVPTIPMNRNQ